LSQSFAPKDAFALMDSIVYFLGKAQNFFVLCLTFISTTNFPKPCGDLSFFIIVGFCLEAQIF